jgi:hypothetical protein
LRRDDNQNRQHSFPDANRSEKGESRSGIATG